MHIENMSGNTQCTDTHLFHRFTYLSRCVVQGRVEGVGGRAGLPALLEEEEEGRLLFG